MRLDHGFERTPRHHGRHLGQEHLAPRELLLRREIERRKAQLVHGVHPSNQWHHCAMLAGLIRGSLSWILPAHNDPLRPRTMSTMGLTALDQLRAILKV